MKSEGYVSITYLDSNKPCPKNTYIS